VTVEQLDHFDVSEELESSTYFTAFRAVHRPTGQRVRLTRIARAISESPKFRAAFRKDEPSLSRLRHANILPFLFRGEDNGQMFYVTELSDGTSLARLLNDGRTISWDEFTDIGWQIASALQHAHNIGITHGRLTVDSIMISAELRSQVVGFGLYRWIAAAQSAGPHEDSLPSRTRRDLIELGTLLATVMDRVHPETASAANENQVADMIDLIHTLKMPPLNFTARDVQGRLGNILLQVSGESIEIIDDRKGQGLSRRSIVDELFDEADASSPVPATPLDASRDAARKAFRALVVFVVAALIAALIWLLGVR